MTRRQMGQVRSPYEGGTCINENDPSAVLFDQFCNANTFQEIMVTFQQLCDLVEVRPRDHEVFYQRLKLSLNSWKAQSLWAKLDKRAGHAEYRKGTACTNTRVLIVGGGPCGLRLGIEVALLGGKAVVVEKRDRFSRNNVLHLWPYLIHDLKGLGAKKFFGKFCAGAIDHISIRALQCILLKVALLVGVEIHPCVSFEGLEVPVRPSENNEGRGWRARVEPADHPVSEYEFDVLMGADGKRNTLTDFRRKEFRGKLAIAITANFINRNTQAEARVEEISGVAYIFNQKFFKDLNRQTGIDLENIVYYKDDTHYFVMTAKKHSLLLKGVLLQDYEDPARLLAKPNVDQAALLSYAEEAADVSTRNMLPNLEFAHNHYGQPDVAMFDFTSMFAAEHASRVLEREGSKLLMGLVGDSLSEPFWPTGSGLARGFLGAFDAAWMIRSWASGKNTPLEIMAERESIYQLLSQTTPENINKNFSMYTLDPNTRYPNLNPVFFKPQQVTHQYDGVDKAYLNEIVTIAEQQSNRYEMIRDKHNLLKWFQKQLEAYRHIIKVLDLSTSWRSGLALCALIHKYRPELVDVYSLDVSKVEENSQLAFDLAEREFGIAAVATGQDMYQGDLPDKLSFTSYLSQFYEFFRKESIRPAKVAKHPAHLRFKPRSPGSKLSLLNKLGTKIRQRREEFEKENDSDSVKRSRQPLAPPGKKRLYNMEQSERPSSVVLKGYRKLEGLEPEEGEGEEPRAVRMRRELKALKAGVRGQNKVSALAKDLSKKFVGPKTPPEAKKVTSRPLISTKTNDSDLCYFCQKTVYLVERYTAEGLYFHRGCFRCEYCSTNLRIGGYAFMRSPAGEAKFYCHQHYGMKRPYRKPRKRSFGDKDTASVPSASKSSPTNLPETFTEIFLKRSSISSKN